MAHVIMAYIVMAHVVMAYIVMAREIRVSVVGGGSEEVMLDLAMNMSKI